MDPLRRKRYQEKVFYIKENLADFSKNPSSELEKKGIFYSIHTAIEALVDLVAMAVKDLGFPVSEDATNIQRIAEERDIPVERAEKLLKANGMRNILVHRYNGIDDQIVLSSRSEIKELLNFWIDTIEAIVNELSLDD